MSEQATEITGDRFVDLSATEQAARPFQVEPRVHKDDFIFVWHAEGRDKRSLEQAAQIYFSDGANSTRQLDSLVRKFLPKLDRPTLLEFASGYGCLTRHLRKLTDTYAVTACDIHPEAVAFIGKTIGVDAVLSHRVPEKFAVAGQFDVVFALSFFSHMPPATFARWINALLDRVKENGILIFTTHGRVGQAEINVASVEPDGHWFATLSEQRDLPTSDYGTMLVRPRFVFDALSSRGDCTLRFFEEAFWWGLQDTYIYEKLRTADPIVQRTPDKEISQRDATINQMNRTINGLHQEIGDLRAEVNMLRDSTSWRITAPLRAIKARLSARR